MRNGSVSGAILCLAAGALLPLAFAPYNLAIVALACPAVLFVMWLHASPRAAFVRGYAFGLGMFGTGVSWLHISINLFGGMSYAGSLAVTFLLVMFLALYPALAGLAGRLAWLGAGRLMPLLLVFPVTWTACEWLRATLLTGFPWLNLGYSQIDSPLGGFAPVLGTFGVTWATAAAAGGIAVLCVHRGWGRAWGAVLVLALAWLGWTGGARQWTTPVGKPISVALVQGAIPQSLKWRPELQQESMDRYRDLTAPLWGRAIIIWPETAIPALYRNIRGFMDALGRRAQSSGSDLYVGLPVSNEAGDKYFNSVLLVDGRGHRYDKRHLVPFGEYLPFRPWLQGIFSFLQIPMSDFSAGDAAQPLLHGRNAVVGVSICYEDTFGDEVAQATPQARILINVSNDAWFGDSNASPQHLEMARMRALENGRYMLRATNNGISAVIDQHGRLVARAPQFSPAVVRAEAQPFEGATPYSRTRDWPVLFLLTAVLGLTWTAGRRRPG